MSKSAVNTPETQCAAPKSRIPLLRRSYSMRLPVDSAKTTTNSMRDCLLMSCDTPCSIPAAGKPPISKNPFASRKRSLSFIDGGSFRRQPEVSLPHSARAKTPLGMYLGAEAEASIVQTPQPKGDDADSLRSFGASSICSSIGSIDHWGLQADILEDHGSSWQSITPLGHPGRFAKNGTTYSGRQKKYVMHCSPHLDNNEESYLTPTQRAVRQIRKLKVVLNQAKKEIEMRDTEIERLKKELAESKGVDRNNCDHHVRKEMPSHRDVDLAIGYLGSDAGDYSDRHDDVDALVGVLADMDRVLQDDNTDRMAVHQTEERLERMGNHDPPSSLADSGHYEDLVSSSSVHSKESLRLSPGGEEDFIGGKTLLEEEPEDEGRGEREEVEEEIRRERRRNAQAIVDLKESHRAEVKALTSQLNEAEEKAEIQQIEAERWRVRAEAAEKTLEESKKEKEANQQKDLERQEALLLKMYLKGQEAARFEHADQVLEFAHKAPSRVSVPELLQQLQDTEAKLEEMKVMYRQALEESKRNQQNTKEVDEFDTRRANDPTITLQFLKSAVYYFLTDRAENIVDHLSAIESILGFSDQEKAAIERANPNLSRK